MSTVPDYKNTVYTVNTAPGITGTLGTWDTTGRNTNTTMPSIVATQGSNNASLQVNGDANFKGNLRVKDRELTDWLETVESRLGMLQVNPKLESEFDELKALGDAYRAAEKRFLEQKRLIEILKKTDE